MKQLAIAAALGATLLAFAAPPTPAAAAPAGSYQESCRRVRDTGNRRNPIISAQCLDARGRYRETNLAYGGCRSEVVNDNGRLTCAGGGRPGIGDGGDRPGLGGGGNRPLPGGSWARSCQPREWARNVLTARCENGNGGREVSTLDLRQCPTNRVGNLYGRLVCQ